MVHIRQQAIAAAKTRAAADYRRGFNMGVEDLNPPQPEDYSSDFWRGYSDGQYARFEESAGYIWTFEKSV